MNRRTNPHDPTGYDDALDELRAALRSNAATIAEALLGPPHHRLSGRHALRWRNKGSLKVVVSGPHRGAYYDFEAREGGDLLKLIRCELGGNFGAAVEWAACRLGIDIGRVTNGRAEDAHRAYQQRLAEQRARASQQAEANTNRAISAAQYSAAHGLPLTADTPAGRYLTETRGIPPPADGWGPSIRRLPPWQGHPEAVAYLATDDTGKVCGIHRVEVTADAKKIDKRSRGAFSVTGAVVRLQGPADGPLLIAEGPETATSLWVATGLETWIACGGLGRLKLPIGRTTIVCRDDDPERSPADHALHRAIAAWQRMGCSFLVATPYATRRHDRSDFNDLIREHGPDAVRARIAAAAEAQVAGLRCYYDPPETDLDAAKAQQKAAMLTHLDASRRWAAAYSEYLQRRAEAFAEAGADNLPSTTRARISRAIHRAVAQAHGFGNRIPAPPAAMISGAQGSGKTSIVRTYIAAYGHGQIWALYEPTTVKAKEEYDNYLAMPGDNKPPAMMIWGRGQPDRQRPGHHMCDRHKTAERVARAGLSVVKTMCQTCPLAGACGDQRQRREAKDLVAQGRGALFTLASEYLFHPSPLPPRHHVIADESIVISGIETPAVPMADIRNLRLPDGSALSEQVQHVLNTICDALDTPCPPRPEVLETLLKVSDEPIPMAPAALLYLRNVGVTRDDLRAASRALDDEIEHRSPPIDGSQADEWIEQTLDTNNLTTLRQAAGLVVAVHREFGRRRTTLTGVVARDGRDQNGNVVREILISRRRQMFGVKHASLTVLDGTGNPDLTRRLFGRSLEHTCIRFPRKLDVTGTRGKTYSRQSLTGMDARGNPMDNHAGSAAKLREEVGSIFQQLPGGSLICAQKRVVEALGESGAIDPGTKVAYFANLRGQNFWEDCPGGLYVGTQTVSPRAIEDIARAYLVDDDAPLISIDGPAPPGWGYRQWPCRATRMRRMRDGSQEAVEVEVHPHPVAQAVLEEVREAELIQAIDRLRSIWQYRQVTVANDLVLDVVYDRTLTHKQMVAGGTPLERAWQASGILPCNRDHLRLLHPHIFKTDWAAKTALYELEHCEPDKGGFLNRVPIWKTTLITYRTIGSTSRQSRALVNTDRHGDPYTAMVAALGPLSMFNGQFVEPDAVPRPPPKPAAFKADLGPATVIPFPDHRVAHETVVTIVEHDQHREQAKAAAATVKATNQAARQAKRDAEAAAKAAAKATREAKRDAKAAAKATRKAQQAGLPPPPPPLPPTPPTAPVVASTQSQTDMLAIAWRALGSQEVAQLWMTTVNPRLAMRRPADVCGEPNGVDACRCALGLRRSHRPAAVPAATVSAPISVSL